MNWRRRLAALLVMLALAGCAQGITGQAGAPNTPSGEHRERARAWRRERRRRWRRYVAGEA